MKKMFFNRHLQAGAVTLALVAGTLFLFSFSFKNSAGDFLQQLGISKTAADQKITNSLLGGYLDQYGLQNAKNIAVGNRAAIAAELLTYTKQYVHCTAFQNEYKQLRDNNKPTLTTIQTPEEMRTGLILQYKKSLAETETNMKKADSSMKKIFTPILSTLRQELKNAEDPANATIAGYKENYPEMVRSLEAANLQRLAEWEQQYPAKQAAFIKQRLQQFLEETAGIDFNAQLIEKNGKKYFANPAYEHRGNRWKLAFRAGKEVVEPARAFVKTWLEEIK